MRREYRNGLVRALRWAAKSSSDPEELLDAADEIERLREAARTFITAMNDCSDYPDTTSDMEELVHAKRKAEAALAKKGTQT